ncbi:lipase family protein [Vibrio cholerae]|nr:lipase family protein [Vibrio cholerae]ELE5868248.1 lipase family protein [Vibrio cholerae]ELG7084225.1 lipase family protein [Vibrio cholerae]ELU8560039.1 lipase family protein [Vibrio cholerae]
MKISESLHHLKKTFANVNNWEDDSFCYDKAFVCGVMSQLAYCHVSDYELENTDHVNLIPSSTFARIISGDKTVTLNSIMNELNIEAPVIIESTASVTVAIEYNDVVFISMRGTENANDWRKNFKCKKIKPTRYVPFSHNVELHKGFYFEVLSSIDLLFDELEKRKWNNKTIYITGHSLGGALAAITFALREYQFFRLGLPFRRNEHPKITSCYTFGMPRWGNDAAIEFFRNPYHLFVSNDLVPSIPLKIMGYEDCLHQYSLDEQSFIYVDFSLSKLEKVKESAIAFVTKKKKVDHLIENYVERIHLRK